MTQTEVKSRMAESLPPYIDAESGESVVDEKQTPPVAQLCTKHTPSQTPNLDRELQSPEHREFVHGLIAALDQAIQEDHCTECAIQKMAELVTTYAGDLKAKKKGGDWSKEEKKALKKEVKEVAKRVKGTVKAMKKNRRM